jgi:hypothetical protein
LPGSVELSGKPTKAWLMRYGSSDGKLRIDKFRVEASAIDKLAPGAVANFHVKGEMSQSFALPSIGKLVETMRQCTVDLQKFWNMTPEDQKRIATPAKGDVRGLFTDRDYPAEALSAEGQAQFLLLVDEAGKVAACHVLKPSGVPSLDGMGCQVIRERANKFRPALDTSGKPVRSTVITPPVVWKMAS